MSKRKANSESDEKKEKRKKIVAPLSHEEFLHSASAIKVNFPNWDVEREAMPVTFNTGSYGWKTSSRGVANVAGEKLQVMMTVNLTVMGSKVAGSSGSGSEDVVEE